MAGNKSLLKEVSNWLLSLELDRRQKRIILYYDLTDFFQKGGLVYLRRVSQAKSPNAQPGHCSSSLLYLGQAV